MKIKILLPLINILTALSSYAQTPHLLDEFASPIILVSLKSPVAAPTEVQAKDRLLWYKGKKINDSILITTTAELILYSKKRNMVVVQPPSAKDPWLKVISRLQGIQQDKKKIVASIAGKPNSFFLYPYVTAAFREYEEQNKDYAKALKNVIPLPESISIATRKQISTGGVASFRLLYTFGVPVEVTTAYREIMEKKKNYPPLSFPPPPQENYGACYECDGIAQNQYAIDKFKWEQEFIKYEADLVQRSLSICRTIEELKLNNDPEAIQIKTDLEKLREFAFARMKNKVDLLIRDYGSDFTRLASVVRMAIAVDRQKQLLEGTENASSQQLIAKLTTLLDGFDAYLEKQMAARNYDVVFNLAFQISMERQRQLLGGEQKDNLGPLLKKFFSFNRFRMEMEVDFSISCDDNDEGTCPIRSASASLTTKKDFYVSIVPYQCGAYQLYLSTTVYSPETESMNRELNYTSSVVDVNKYELELTVSEGTEKNIYVDDEGNTHIRTESFKGNNVLSHLPLARIHFCKDKEDTLHILGFYNKAADKQGQHLVNPVAYYMDLMLANVSEEELNAHANEIAGGLEAYEKRMKTYEVEPTGFATLDKLQNQHSIFNLYQKSAENTIKYAATKDAAILFNAENGEEEIMNASTDVSGREIETMKVNKGKVKVKIVHDPLLYKTN